MIRVILVDDEEDALNLLQILLGEIGDVEVAGRFINPVQAIEYLTRCPVDAVFLDNQMPGMKGTEAARAIREMYPQLPIVFTTAYAEYAVEAFEIQSTDYLLKPFTVERLQNAVGRIRQSLSLYASAPSEASRNANPFAIQCLGGFHMQLSGEGNKMLSWRTKKVKELCAFLIHHGGKPVDTATIIEEVWPEYEPDKAKTNMYTCMFYLRRSLAENNVPVRIQKADQGFVASLEGVTVDVTEFERLLRRVLSEEELNERLYDQINLMYKGDYMEACDFGWAAVRQMELKKLYIRALRKWYVRFLDRNQTALAADSMQRVLTLAPDSEADGRALIKLHLEAGNRNEALQVYLQLEHMVRIHLGAELEEGTVRLFRHALDQTEGRARG
ncbi:Two-component response regulator, SAPR family, consists of REC, wHTH and BTAD domains [Paenibacillus sp. UNCCL117]|uniref:response regulator n=1 Tax=unclassified Paenibacillus TaxID=185978 RepID=UPI000888587A|nr:MULTISPECIES: response regulator [unclassified Paenibacillus]SDC25292.1 Two-component response regulator, SAPR family, consists of REC, wHTH and BTAD domains [Paenibacillus sp. cl123]SFW19789.1 Two-component response regulator, SAPR family, consists of REC, wHTH and BTAD domains [Paenibacillus sp. UNCCL117]